jgi:hypothetical protein
MRTLSLRQPWATVVARGWKTIENRGRRIAIPDGPLAIHASMSYDGEAENFVRATLAAMGLIVPSRAEMRAWPRGSVVGVVASAGWTTPMFAPEHGKIWAFGPCCLILEPGSARELARPIPWRGQIIPFDVPDDLIAQAA